MLPSVNEITEATAMTYTEMSSWLKSERRHRARHENRLLSHQQQTTIFPENVMVKIVGFLDVTTSGRMAATCNMYHEIVAQHHRQAVHTTLSPFTRNPDGFLLMLGMFKAIISGPLAMAALIPSMTVPNCLDIYAPDNNVQAIMGLLAESFNYQSIDGEPGHHSDHTYPSRLMMRRDTVHRADKAIHIYGVAGRNPLLAIFAFKSTVAMNFISFRGVFCAYPQLTLELKGLINRGGVLHEETINRCRFYDDMGFRHSRDMVPFLGTHVCGQAGSCPRTLRNLYDRHGLFWEFPRPVMPSWYPKQGIVYDDSNSVAWMLDCATGCTGGPVERGFRMHIDMIDNY